MGLSKLLRSASARPTWLGCQSAWLHFRSVLTAKDLKFRFHTSALPWLPKTWCSASTFPLCLDWQRSEVPRPLFCSALTAKNVKFRFRIRNFCSAFTAKYVKFCSRASALPLLAKIWSSAFRTCSARTSKYVKFRFRISSLPGLPKICSFASALSLSLDCQRSEDRLLH